MPLTNEDIVSAIVAYYKRTGVDMTALLGDPTFNALKVPDKIEAIKKYSADIHAGSSSNLGSAAKKSIAVEAVMSALPVIPATIAIARTVMPHLMPGVKTLSLAQAAGGGLVFGLGTGAILAYARARQAQDYRNALRRNLANVVQNPDTINAIGVLSTSNVQGQSYSLKNHLVSRALELYKPERMDHWVTDQFKDAATEHNITAIERQKTKEAYAIYEAKKTDPN